VVSWFLYSSRISAEISVEYGLVAMCIGGFAYLLNRYTDYSYDVIVDKGLIKVPRRIYLLFSFFFLFIGLSLMIKNIVYIFPVFLGIVFGIFYSLKTFFRYPLKNYFVIKNIFASGSKYIGTMCGVLLFKPMTLVLFFRSISMFAFHLIYEILWDIRDIKSDTVGKVATIPRFFGRDVALGVCFIIWSFSLFSQFIFIKQTDYFFIKYEIVLLFILSLVKIKDVRWFHVMIYFHIVLNLIFINKEVLIYISSKF
jgi:4-hydroxybenzoate polyprenyltransferase